MTPFINGWTREKVIEHIKANFKGQSYSQEFGCTYRHKDGKKCAAGMFIPDSLYEPAFEKAAINANFVWNRVHRSMPLYRNEMRQLQQLHDEAENDEQCLTNMLAYVEGL